MSTYTTIRMHDDYRLLLEQWISLLSFATRFVCDKIRSRAIREIEDLHAQLDPVDRVVLAVRHGIPQWLLPAYQDLCQRQDPPTLDEGRKLGMPTVISLMKAREMLLNDSLHLRMPQSGMSSSSQYLLNRQSMPRRADFFDLFNEEPQPQPHPPHWRFSPSKVTQVVKQVFELE
jgi:hypothetical protein